MCEREGQDFDNGGVVIKPPQKLSEDELQELRAKVTKAALRDFEVIVRNGGGYGGYGSEEAYPTSTRPFIKEIFGPNYGDKYTE